MKEKSQRIEIEGEIGRIPVENGSNLVPEHQPKDRIYTLCQRELFLMVGASLSYHKGLELLNRLLHRNPDTTIKFRTYRDFCERIGKQIENCVAQEARDLLNAHHFDAESGKPTQPLASELTESAQPYKDNAAIQCAIEKINAARPSPDGQVKASLWQIGDSKQTCYLSFDDIGVKHQKERRIGNGEKNGV